jgi:hypothetical protein
VPLKARLNADVDVLVAKQLRARSILVEPNPAKDPAEAAEVEQCRLMTEAKVSLQAHPLFNQYT